MEYYPQTQPSIEDSCWRIEDVDKGICDDPKSRSTRIYKLKVDKTWYVIAQKEY